MSTFSSTLFSGKRFAVVGLGKNGLPGRVRGCARWGADVVAWDDNPAMRAAASGLDLRDPSRGSFDFDALVLSPGIPHRLPQPHPAAQRAIDSGVPILSERRTAVPGGAGVRQPGAVRGYYRDQWQVDDDGVAGAHPAAGRHGRRGRRQPGAGRVVITFITT